MATIVSDTFTGTSGTALTSHTPDTDTVGGGWVNDSGGIWKINASNQAFLSVAQNSGHIAIEASNADVLVTVDTTVNSGSSSADRDDGVIGRWTASTDYWKVAINNTANLVRITERNGGVNTVRASTAFTASGTHTIAATFNGSTISATVDGGNSVSYASATHNQTATKHGLCGRNTTDIRDNFSIASLTAAAASLVIPRKSKTYLRR